MTELKIFLTKRLGFFVSPENVKPVFIGSFLNSLNTPKVTDFIAL